MRLLVCGDRKWPEQDRAFMYSVLDKFHAKYQVTVVIEGEAPGADKMSREWAELRGILLDPYEAQWDRYRPKTPGRKNPAGAIRNRQMLTVGKPEYVLAFHRNPAASHGTKDMVTIARQAGIPTVWVPVFEGEGFHA